MSSYSLSNFSDVSDCKVSNVSLSHSLLYVCDNFGTTFKIDLLDESVIQHRSCEDPINACCVIDENQIALGIRNELFLYDAAHLDTKPADNIHRRELPITCCMYNATSKLLFESSMGPNICAHSIGTPSHTASVKTNEIGIKWFSLGQNSYLSYIDNSSNVVILKFVFQGSSNKIIGSDLLKNLNRVKPVEMIRNSSLSYRMGWHPTEPIVAIPSTMGSIIYCFSDSDGNWQDEVLTSAHQNHEVNIATFSPCGKYLASCAVDGSIALWKIENKSKPSFDVWRYVVSDSTSVDKSVVDLMWYGQDLIVVTHCSWTILKDFGFDKTKHESVQYVAVSPSLTSNITNITRAPESFPHELSQVSKFKRLKKLKATTDIQPDDLSDEEVESISVIKQQLAPVRVSPVKGSTDEDNELDADADREEVDTMEGGLGGKIEKYIQEYAATSIMPGTAVTFQHDVVQLGSTKYDEKGRRYLVWNSIGNITTRTEAVSNRIEIRFANKSRRNKQEAFPDNWGFTMAALSHEGAVFASEPIDDDTLDFDEISKKRPKQGSTIYYHAFSAGTERLHGANESFTMKLNLDEAALSVAAGCGWVAVVTSRGFLRLFSSTGHQLSVSWLKGPVVAVCGYETLLAIVYNSGVVYGGFSLGMELLQITPNDASCSRQLAVANVPLAPGAKLEWMCFSVDTHVLFIQDSAGIVSMFSSSGASAHGSWLWIPVLEIDKFKKSSGHKYWPITVLEDKLAYVLLNGENKPAIYPEPVVTTRAFRIPICETKEGKDKGEDVNERVHQIILEGCRGNYLQQLILDNQITGKNILGASADALDELLAKQQVDADRIVLKLFQESCRLQRIAQAVDLAMKIRTEKALGVAIAIANHFGRSVVAQRVEDIMQFRRQISVDIVNPENDYDSYVGHSGTSTSQIAQEKQRPQSILDSDNSTQQKRVAAVNPFAKSSDVHSPLKKRSNTLEDESPASKKATLSRQSSFSQEARSKKVHDRTLL